MYCAYITTIKTLRKHPNADRLRCTTLFGNNVIVGLDIEVGQRVVYFPVDGQLGREYAEENCLLRVKDANGKNTGGYLDPDKRNIKAIKLRGEQSDGLVLPIETLAPYTDVSKLRDGDTVTILGGVEICRKYIPRGQQTAPAPIVSRTHKDKVVEGDTVSYPYFAQHVETDQLAYKEHAFREGDICYITLKMHGTSARTMNAVEVTVKQPNKLLRLFGAKEKVTRRYKTVSGSRRVVLKTFDGTGYQDNAFRRKYHELFKQRLPKGVEIFYEIVGWVNDNETIMGTCPNEYLHDKEFSRLYGKETVFSYGCAPGQNECYVYRMTLTNEDGFTVELPWERVVEECRKMDVNCVPTFEKFIFTTWEDLMARVEKYYDGPDPIGKTHIREGVVVRIENRPSFTAFKHKNFGFKSVEGAIKELAQTPDLEEAEELLIEETN